LNEEPKDENNRPALDEEAVVDCRSGIERFYSRYHERLVHSLRAILSSKEEAQEVAHDAYLHILKRGGMRTLRYLRHLLFRTAINRAFDRLRGRKHRTRYATLSRHESDTDLNHADAQTLAQDSLHRLTNFLDELPETHREALRLYRVNDLPREEVARQLGVTARTVSRYVNQAIIYCSYRLEGLPATQARELAKL
jgi:RNA polymerase sigma factor (sigma-70 family)